MNFDEDAHSPWLRLHQVNSWLPSNSSVYLIVYIWKIVSDLILTYSNVFSTPFISSLPGPALSWDCARNPHHPRTMLPPTIPGSGRTEGMPSHQASPWFSPLVHLVLKSLLTRLEKTLNDFPAKSPFPGGKKVLTSVNENKPKENDFYILF